MAGGIAGVMDEDGPCSATFSLNRAGGRASPALVKAATRTMLAAYIIDLLGLGRGFRAAVDAEGGHEVFVELEPHAVA